MQINKFKPITNIYKTYDEWEDMVNFLPKGFRDTINIYQPRKVLYHRKSNPTKAEIIQYQREDEQMIFKFKYERDISGLLELIDNYTPLIKSVAENPFKYIKGKSFYGLNRLIKYYRHIENGEAYHYLSSLAEDIMQEIITGFIELVYNYRSVEGFFSGYIKNYLPYKVKNVYMEFIRYCRALYIDGLEEEHVEEFYMEHLSCYIPDEKEKLDLSRFNLTEQQKKVALLLSEGLNISQAARVLGISRAGINKHISLIRKKLKISQNAA